MARGRRAGGCLALIILALVTGVAVAVGPGLWDQYGDQVFAQSRCSVTLDGHSHSLTAAQADNAALIVAMSVERDLPARAATIAIATAIQESDLRNLDYGDRDSVGLFQQRPSQGWGSVEEIMDPYYSAGKFYDGLVKVKDWPNLPVTEAAQAVQRSGFPNAYADHESEARLWASALTGHGGEVTCDLPDASLGSMAGFAERLQHEFGDVAVVDVSVIVDAQTVRVVAADATARNAVAQWAVATANQTQAVEVISCGATWRRAGGEWERDPVGECADLGVTVRIGG